MGIPAELAWARLVDGLGQRYGKFPREVEEEDVSLLQLVALVEMGKEKPDGG